MRMWKKVAAVLALTLAAGPTWVSAQQPNRPQRALSQEERAQLEERVRRQLDQRLREEMGLSSEEQERFQGITQDYRDRRLELSLARRQLQVRLRREGRRDDLTDDQARELLAQTLDLAQQELALLTEEQEALLTILTPAQLVQLYQWREALAQRLRRARGGGDGPGSVDGGRPLGSSWP